MQGKNRLNSWQR